MEKILIIEDNEDIRQNIIEILELADYEVIQAANGKEGVDQAILELPDLIICDIMMPKLDGYGVLHILSKRKSTIGIPFIFLTAKADKMEIRKGMTLGADDYITKPFDDNELLDVIVIRLKKANVLKDSYKRSFEGINNFISDAVSFDEFLQVSNSKKHVFYKKRSDVYHSGEIPNQLYFVISGKIKTQKMSNDGKELITDIHAVGDFFGYEDLLSEHRYTDHAKAMEDSELIMIPKADFFQLIYNNKQIAKKFIELLSNKIVEKEENLLRLAYSSVRQRTAQALITLSDKYNSERIPNYALKITREELSNIIGTATESVIRVVSEFKDEGVLIINSRNIIINSVDKLAQIAKWNVAKRG